MVNRKKQPWGEKLGDRAGMNLAVNLLSDGKTKGWASNEINAKRILRCDDGGGKENIRD